MAVTVQTKGNISVEEDIKRLCQALLALAVDDTAGTTYTDKNIGASDSVQVAIKKLVSALEGGVNSITNGEGLTTAIDDTAAASAGVPVGGVYVTATGDVKVRIA